MTANNGLSYAEQIIAVLERAARNGDAIGHISKDNTEMARLDIRDPDGSFVCTLTRSKEQLS